MHANSDYSRLAEQRPLQIYVVSHTHWDREWYHSAARFRQRLVALLDAVLERTNPGETFLLDGQTITLLDYLAVRPEQEPVLRAQLQTGALEAGPWFVLADNLMPCGEAILRNLEAGHRVLRRFGAVPPPVAYCPDTFGHPAALPAIAAGYGFPAAIVWRGAGGAGHPNADAFCWVAADGSSVAVHHLSPDGYEYGSALPVGPESAAARWAHMRSVLTARNRTGVVLLLNGADHHALQPDITAAVEALRHAATPDAHFAHVSLTTFIDRFVATSANASLPIVRGELRDSYGYTWTLSGTLGTRAHQKRQNARLERALLRDVEPWLVLSWLHHAASPSSAARANGAATLVDLPALLNIAWQDLLETHPHDTLCGCSIDEVARAMGARQESVASQVRGLRDAGLQLALAHDSVAARTRPVVRHIDQPVVVRNRAAIVRGGVAELYLFETLADVAVGPGSAAPLIPAPVPTASRTPRIQEMAVQTLFTRVRHTRRESPQHYPDNDLVRVHRVVAWVPEVPALGLRVFATAGLDGHDKGPVIQSPGPSPVYVAPTASGIVLGNEHLRVTIRDGQVDIEQRARRVANALALESVSDLGDSYTPSLRGSPERLTCVKTRIVHRGPLRAAVRLSWESAARDVRVHTTLILDAAADVLRCDVRGLNRRRNHRLRLSWRTEFRDAFTDTVADAAFGPVAREIAVAPMTATETVIPTMPMHRWVTQSRHGHAVTVFSDGLAEAESAPGALSLTLLRAIGELSRADLPERPGHAGWPSPIPDAQSLGRFSARVGIMLHDAGAGTATVVSRAADSFLLPLCGETWRDLDAVHTPPLIAGPELHGAALEASAITLAQRSDGIILRAVNLEASAVQGHWLLPHDGPWLATRCRLDETPIAATTRHAARVDFIAGPRETVTLHIAAAR